MLKIAVIADDLTGAADTGVQFCRLARPNYLVSSAALWSLPAELKPEGLAIYTDSRHLTPDQAARSAGAAARGLKNFAPETVYKKVDSTLRGNLGTEICSVMDEMDLEMALVAPAFPGQGRVTKNDMHMINGVPVAETEMARDPVAPISESRLSLLLAAQSNKKVGRVDLSVHEGGDQSLAGKIAGLKAEGKKVLAVDATLQEHLDSLARVCLAEFPRTLLVGSAGLALGLASALAHDGYGEEPTPPQISGGMLWVCGSASPRMARQCSELVRAGLADRLVIDPWVLCDEHMTAERQSLAREVAKRLEKGSLALALPVLSPAGGPSAGRVAAGLAEVARFTLDLSQPPALFLSGGDTALAVLAALGAQALLLKSEFVPGMVWSRLQGGILDGKTVVTKAGAFGEPGALVEVHRKLFNRTREKE